jgi:hypothetical protein
MISEGADTHSGNAAAQRWLRDYEQRNSAKLPPMRRPYAVDATDRGDHATRSKTMFVSVLEHVPFTAPWRERQRLQREHSDLIGHLRKYLADQAEPSRTAFRSHVRQARSNISSHSLPLETAASDPFTITKESGTPNEKGLSNHVRGRVA